MLCYHKQATPLRIANAIIKIILVVRTEHNKILNKVGYRPKFCINIVAIIKHFGELSTVRLIFRHVVQPTG